MDEFRVPQRKIAVELTLVGGHRINGEAYAPSSGPRGEPGRLVDRLNDARERFLPVTGPSRSSMVRKRAIITVRLGPEDAAKEIHAEEREREVPVEVTMEEGLSLKGRVAYTLPPERSRLLDYFNAAPRFFTLLDDLGATLVNADRAVEVGRLDEPGSRD